MRLAVVILLAILLHSSHLSYGSVLPTTQYEEGLKSSVSSSIQKDVEDISNAFHMIYDFLYPSEDGDSTYLGKRSNYIPEEYKVKRNRERIQEQEAEIDSNSRKRSESSNEKRQTNQPSDDKKACSSVGIMDYQTTVKNVCDGKICFNKQFNCSGIIYNNITEYSGNAATDCTVTELTCESQTVNMAEQHNARNCKVIDVVCLSNKRIPGSKATPVQLQSCITQLLCDGDIFYGFADYGYTCVQQELICNGENVTYSNVAANNRTYLDTLSNCSVNQYSCSVDDSTCYSFTSECDGDTVNGCTLKKFPTTCSTGSNTTNCKIAQLTCDGVQVDLTKYRGPYNNCTVNKLNCSGSALDDTTYGQNCLLNEMSCFASDRVVNLNTFVGSVDNCRVSKLQCPASGASSSCTLFKPVCSSEPKCIVSATKFSCENLVSCNKPLNDSVCICPDDRTGSDCSKYRDIVCGVTLKSPPLNCNHPAYQSSDPKDALLDGDRPCLVFSLDESANLEYQLKCQFGSDNILSNVTLGQNTTKYNFTYWLEGDDFRISKPTNWTMLFKIFNFNVLSDNGASKNIVLSKEQMIGKQNIWFNTTLKEVPDKYWHGNRLYSEIGWVREIDFQPAGTTSRIMDRRFLDSPDYKGKGTDKKSSNKSEIILAVVLPAIGVLIIAIVAFVKREKVYRILGYKQVPSDDMDDKYQ